MQSKDVPGKPFTVVIDPGHGGQDPGAVYRNIREKDIVLKLGLKLADYIRENMPDVQIVFTRDKDVFIPLHQRAAIANNSHADLFISLHANYCGTPSITGTETFVLGLHRSEENLEVAKKENSVILLEEDYSTRYEGFDPNSSESYIMFEMVQDEYLDQSISMAAFIQDQFKNRAARKDRGVKQAGFLVLRRTSMPSVLIEAGFLSNPGEAQYLNSDEGQSYLASAIYRAFKDYKISVDTRSDYKLVTQQTAQSRTEQISAPVEKGTNTSPAANRKITFSVQLAVISTRIEPTPSNFNGLTPVFVREQNGMFKYFYGRESSYEEILKRKNEAAKHFRDAFITAFELDNQIPLKKALRKSDQ
ncbi:N-acetylmuramoyl-L-alanine amidase family protein [Gaoshiqia sediminis]|uniref:N-acetylmuramoyl-L-alanine amidase n=1 Tax=Gaoshiqia sediminis TaxID=2986998 RepID=A0AA41Y2F4_9BACT|nr:N-acetylmuramoyl-L-alanine amidase [Gaoshiqia sediminis]MCW0482219.1 N-acetylmuramoyl-L-alanine amidase [Gaoshiqia sediminis]